MSAKSTFLKLHSNKNSINCGEAPSMEGNTDDFLWDLYPLSKYPPSFWYPFSDHESKGWPNGRLASCRLDLLSSECKSWQWIFFSKALGHPSFFFMEVFFWEMFVQNTQKYLQYFLKITHTVLEASEHIKINGDDFKLCDILEKPKLWRR